MVSAHKARSVVPVSLLISAANTGGGGGGGGACTVHVLCACMKKESQESPEHTSEHVKSQNNFLAVCPGP